MRVAVSVLFAVGALGFAVPNAALAAAPVIDDCDSSFIQDPESTPLGGVYWLHERAQCDKSRRLRDREIPQAIPDATMLHIAPLGSDAPLLSFKKADFKTHYNLGNDVFAFVLTQGITLVHMKTGKITPTNFDSIVTNGATGATAPENVFVWRMVSNGQPVPAYQVLRDGSMSAPVANSDMRRLSVPGGARYCDGAATTAALAAENFAMPGWSERRRLSVEGPTDTIPGATADENCLKYHYHYLIGRRASDGLWQLMEGQHSQVLDPAAYPSFEAAVADVHPAITRAQARYTQATQMANANAARDAAAQEAALTAARARVKELQAAGRFAEAAQHAETNLPLRDWGLAVVVWREAPLAELERIFPRLRNTYGAALGDLNVLDTRFFGLRECEKRKPTPSEMQGNFEYTMNYGPKRMGLAEFYASMVAARGSLRPDANEDLVFDAADGQWKKIYDSTGRGTTRVINIPTPEQDAANRNAAGQARVSAYLACVANVQLQD